jgi:lipoate-protein ligase A
MNMAMDEFLLKKGEPTVRFYKWKPSAISIGYFQSIGEEVNINECKSRNVDIVRRITGGGAVYHDEKGEITYSIAAPESLVPTNILESYSFLCSGLVEGLKLLGLDAKFEPINDVIVNGKKISGSAHTRRYRNVLQHGTILLKLNVEKMFSLLRVSNEKIKDKDIRSAKERVTSIEREIGEIEEKKVIDAMIEGFERAFDIQLIEGEMGDEELSSAEKLREKYASKEWNFKR